MPSVTYIEHGGTEHKVAVESGDGYGGCAAEHGA